MPLYFFDTDDGERHFRDDTGITLGTLDEAEVEAVGLLRDLVHLKMPVGRRMMTAIVRYSKCSVVFRGVMTVTGRRYGQQESAF